MTTRVALITGCGKRDGMGRAVALTLAAAGIATRARFAPIAGAGGIVEIPAARSLQQIAADGGGIAKLRRRARQQRLGHRRIGPRETGIVGEIGIAHQRAVQAKQVEKHLLLKRRRLSVSTRHGSASSSLRRSYKLYL